MRHKSEEVIVIISAEYKKGVCQCNKCFHVFHQSEVNRIQTEHNGHNVIEAVCPECGSNTYGLLDFTYYKSIENVYKTEKFFRS